MTDNTRQRVPLEQPTAMSFDTSPRAVRAWVADLPMANVGETTRRIYHVLREVNGLDVPVKQRFNLLQELRAPVALVLPALERHYAYQPYPLPPKSRRVAQLVIDLLKQLVTGYRLVIEAKQGSWLAQRSQQALLTPAMHHLLEYFGLLLHGYRMANLAYPRGLWHNVHRLYASALRGRRAETALEGLEDGGREITIEFLYRRILLLSLLTPQKIGRRAMEEIIGSMALWAPLLKLVPCQAEEIDTPFCVRLDRDHGPGMISLICDGQPQRCGGHNLLLNMAAIERRLHDSLTASRNDTLVLTHERQEYRISRKALKFLLTNWCKPPQRADARHQASGRLEITIGLRGLHHALSRGGVDGVEDEIELKGLPDEDTPELDLAPSGELDTSGAFVGGRQNDDDVFHMSATDNERKSWTDNVDVERAYRVTEAEVQDASRGGYRLRLNAGEVSRLAIGDLIGMRGGPGRPWAAASVRWLSESGDGALQMGVQMLAGICEACTVRVRRGKQKETQIEAIVGRDRESRSVLMVPSLNSLDQGELFLERGEHVFPFRRTLTVVESAMFEAYHYDVQGVQMPGAPPKKTAKGGKDEGDQYESLWDDL